MTAGIHERIDLLTRHGRCLAYYAVGFVATAVALLLDASVSTDAALVLLTVTAVFLFLRFLRELKPDRMAIPAELRVILRKPRSK